MNDGIVTLVIQWCFICLIWMGSLDRPLTRFPFSRGQALAVITVFLLCSLVSWRLYFLPIEVNISGAVLPLFLAGWIYTHLPEERRRYLFVSTFFLGCLLFFFRKVVFWDPVLLIIDEALLLPMAIVAAAVILARSIVLQVYILLVSLTLADAFFALSQMKQAGSAAIGTDYAQDVLWVSLALWFVVLILWSIVKRGAVGLWMALFQQMKWKSKTDSDR